jgi:hypothetical protein
MVQLVLVDLKEEHQMLVVVEDDLQWVEVLQKDN